MVNDILILENSNIWNQYDSFNTNLYSGFKLNPPSYSKVNSDFKKSSNNLKVYHQNTQESWGVNQASYLISYTLSSHI